MTHTDCIDSTISDTAPPAVGRALDRLRVARLQAGEACALQDIMDAHGAAVHRMARSIIGDAGSVEEVAQDVFLALWKNPERFDAARAGLGTYLVAMARNKAIDRLRSHHARDRATDSLVEHTRTRGTTSHAEHHVELRSSLVPLIETLPPLQREALVLAYYGGRTYKQVAQELHIPEGTAKTRLRQALTFMRGALEGVDLVA